MQEIWKDIKNYEGIYQVSNKGNVRSLERYIKRGQFKVLKKQKILKPFIRQGYCAVKLYKNGHKVTVPIHRLVASTFILNVNNYLVVNHIDGNKTNNRAENLEWCTHSDNTKHAYKIGLNKISEKQRKNGKMVYKLGNQATRKKVNQYSLSGEFIKCWNSISEANRNFNSKRTRINDVCRGKCKQSMGYIWQYAE